MTTPRLVAVALLTTVLSVSMLGVSSTASACSCAGWTDIEAFDSADVVFAGQLLRVVPENGPNMSEPQRFVFAVDQVYKGEARAHQWITSFGGRGTCGLELSGNGQFVMFADTASEVTADLDMELYSSLCSGNRLLDAGAVPPGFGPGHAPIAGTSPIGRFDDGGSVLAPILIGGAVAALALVAMFASRKARTV